MPSKRKSRKRKSRSRVGGSAPAGRTSVPASAAAKPGDPRGYARSRARDEEARAALEPLAPGERPAAVTLGAVAAGLLALANLVALLFGYRSGDDTVAVGSDLTGSAVVTALLALIAYGMWRARYWAVLGLQTLLAITIVFAALALVTVVSLWGAVLLVIILAAAGTLFWFLVKAMARIQMPQRPGSQRTG